MGSERNTLTSLQSEKMVCQFDNICCAHDLMHIFMLCLPSDYFIIEPMHFICMVELRKH